MNNRSQLPIETQESFEVIDGIESDYDELPDFTPDTPNAATGTLLYYIILLSFSFTHYLHHFTLSPSSILNLSSPEKKNQIILLRLTSGSDPWRTTNLFSTLYDGHHDFEKSSFLPGIRVSASIVHVERFSSYPINPNL